ncbi:retrovirus-related pol polyprotein from transposon TNT 1-94 [Tanacetum coccineum]
MITIHNKMEDRKSSRLMETMDIMDLIPFVGNVLYITQDRGTLRSVLMPNISNYGSNAISEVSNSETYLNDMDNQSVLALHDFEQSSFMDFIDNEISSDSNIIPYSQYLQETQQATVQDTNLQAQQDSMILSVIEQMSEQMINHVNNWEKANKEQNIESIIAELERYKERVKTFEQRLNIDLSRELKMDVPSELPKVSLVNTSLKKLKFHLTQFDSVVKKRTTPSALEEVELAKAKQPLDSELDFAYKYSTRIQELLVYVQDMCPNAITPSSKKIVVTPMNNVKKVRFTEPITSSRKTQQVESSKTSDSNARVLSSTGVKCSTSNCGSKPPGNKKNDRILQKPSRNKKNNIEAQPRKVNKVNRVAKPVCDVDVKHSLSNANFETLCASCNTSMFDAVYDKCLLDFAKNGNNRSKSAKKHKKQNIWKPTGHVFTEVGYKWKPTGRTFTLVGKISKKSFFKPKAEDTNQEKLYLLHMDFCGPMRVASINGKRYILVIVDDYSKFTWVRILKTKDEAPAAIIKCIKNIKVRLKATVRNVRTDNGTEFVNQTLREWYENVGITHQTSVARTPQQNGVVERRNQTLVEAAQTMLIFSRAPLFLWTEAINTACYTKNRSLIRLRYNKTPYELMQNKKPDLSFFHVFGSLCYHTNDHDDLGKFDAKADIGIFVGYAPAKKAFKIYNRRTQIITETIHVTFDELTGMASEQFSSRPRLHCMTPATSSTGLGSNPVSQQPCIPPIGDDWDRLFQPMFDEYFNPPPIVVSPVQEAVALRAEVLAESPMSTSIDQDAPSIKSPKTPTFHDDPLNESPNEDSTSHGSSSNVRQIHTLLEHIGRWTKDHPIANVIGNPSRSVSTRKQLHTDAMWCYFDAFLTSVEPKNFKQAMTEPSWIDAMQEEIHEFERLEV